MNHKGIFQTVLMTLLVALMGLTALNIWSDNDQNTVEVEAASKKSTKKVAKKSKKTTKRQVADGKDMVGLKKFKYTDASEKKKYPDLNTHANVWIDVDITTQRTYIKEGNKKLYEMYASTGKHDTTPRGTYYIQNERGDFFYTAPLKMGAYYWVSFLHHGEYLFHTTPTDVNGKYDEKIAKTLGREPSSHGCVHLSIADCKWIYDNVPTGTKVVIHGKYHASKMS